MKKLLIFIPTFNRCESLKLCVSRLLAEIIGLESEIEIYISDNNSTDESYRFLKSINNEVISISKNNENIGASLNAAKAHDLKNICEYTLIIGDDDYIIGGALKKLIAYLNGNLEIDFFFINTLSFAEDSRPEVLEVLNASNWHHPPNGGNLKSRISQDFRCSLSELFDPRVDEVLGGSIMCYVFRSSLVSNHLEGLIKSNVNDIYTSYPHTLNWIYSFSPSTSAAFISMPVTINFWHGGNEWGSLGYHRVVSQGLGFLLFELIRLGYIKNENVSDFFEHYMRIAKNSILLMIKEDDDDTDKQLSRRYLNLLIEKLITTKF
jgi:glycosyltransferase involved in cell wall biosynthesis